MLVVILLASTALGLESIREMFGTMLSFIPTLIAAIVIVILGMIVGEFVRALVLASAGAVEGVPTLARAAKGAVVMIAVFMAVQHLGVADELVTAAFTLILGAAALSVGLAFGLGNRDLAGEMTRRWYEEGKARRERRRMDRMGRRHDDPPVPEDWSYLPDHPRRFERPEKLHHDRERDRAVDGRDRVADLGGGAPAVHQVQHLVGVVAAAAPEPGVAGIPRAPARSSPYLSLR